ncbi:MAG: FAD-dependent oxidoreductase [Bdellovibrionaceae bacterium]|nr:FAD-dependent oxidoreductase [Pseudobdellovibrionaceae bacterium]
MSVDRRDFLKLGLQSGLAYLTLNPVSQVLAQNYARRVQADPSPLRPVVGPFSSTNFNGDEYTRPHNILWDIAGYVQSKGGKPAVSEKRDVVIVGGGISGLSSAYFLQGKRPLLLEQGTQFGGNSKGEIFEGAPFSIGAAYLTVPEQGSSLHRMLHTVGALPAGRHEKDTDAKVMVGTRGFQSLWNGEADPDNKGAIEQIVKDFTAINEKAYPSIPWQPGGMNRREMEQLDQGTFLQWLQQRYGNKIPASLLEYFQLYCWSSFGGSIDEISAAQALNFLVAETEGIVAFPGGNSYVAQMMYQHLLRTLGPDSLRSNTIVLEVKTTPQGVEVLIEDAAGQLKTILCKACVVASPKNVANFLVPEMTPQQRALAKSIQYRAYVVANVALNQRVPSPCFDAFRMEGNVPPSPRFGKPGRRPFADVCFANWAMGDRANRSILTIYKPFPYDGARNTLYDGPAFERVQKEVAASVGEILQAMKVPMASIGGLRLSRWGHSLPLAAPRFFSTRQDEIFMTPTNGRIFYANQDNMINPSFEAAFDCAEIAASQILRMI